jgi:pimeloyl-ACP methyl ester carboxylesterase
VTDRAAGRSTVRSQDGTAIAYETFGTGDGVTVIGGALSSGRNYSRFARELGRSFAVHVIERRGRGCSGPQGHDYSIDKELQDLQAVQTATGAAAVFGHSYGGLIALEAARRSRVFTDVAVYEPGVSVRGSIVVDWIPRYRELLTAGDSRGAFAAMVQRSGIAPKAIQWLPLSCVRLILRLAIRTHRWQEMQPLLEANLAEHEQIARLDETTVDRYSSARECCSWAARRVLVLPRLSSSARCCRRSRIPVSRSSTGSTTRGGREGTRLGRRAGAPAFVSGKMRPATEAR